MNIPSIFNDVIGPVMRGPSSSHSAAAVRIGKIARELMGGSIGEVHVYFDLKGSLPTTYLSQGSDMGLCGGLMGFEAEDERLLEYKSELEKAAIKVQYFNGDYGDHHPNTYNLTLKNEIEEHTLVALSTGGGAIEIIQIDDLAVSFFGDCYGLAVWCDSMAEGVIELLKDQGCEVCCADNGKQSMLFAASTYGFDDSVFNSISTYKGVKKLRRISPVLPVCKTRQMQLPFTTAREMEQYSKKCGIGNLADLAICYECERGGVEQSDVMKKAYHLLDITEKAIDSGLQGTEYDDRILGVQASAYQSKHQKGTMLDLGLIDRIIPNVTALMEAKSAMEVIVAAPTAGSCGALPGTISAVGNALNLNREEKARGLLAAGIIGVLIATKSTFSAEICGCQAECGVSSGMIAAAVSTMMGSNMHVSLAAASMALQNIFGMVCDPVANRVEVPCLGKNILAATNGVSSANLALAGFDHVIPFDEVVEAMDKVGRALPHELRCTALGGLSITPTSKNIFEKMKSS